VEYTQFLLHLKFKTSAFIVTMVTIFTIIPLTTVTLDMSSLNNYHLCHWHSDCIDLCLCHNITNCKK